MVGRLINFHYIESILLEKTDEDCLYEMKLRIFLDLYPWPPLIYVWVHMLIHVNKNYLPIFSLLLYNTVDVKSLSMDFEPPSVLFKGRGTSVCDITPWNKIEK